MKTPFRLYDKYRNFCVFLFYQSLCKCTTSQSFDVAKIVFSLLSDDGLMYTWFKELKEWMART